MMDIAALKPGEGYILPDGRLVHRTLSGEIRLDGDPDDVLHPQQTDVVTAYQRKNGLPVTGVLDARTKAHLKDAQHGKA